MTSILKISTVFCFLAALLWSENTSAQQDPLFSQYYFNPLTINSGYAGARNSLNATFIAREQWVGVEGRPRTHSFSMHSPLQNESIAFGFTFMRDQVGPVQSTVVAGDIAYRFKVSKKARLALGLKGGVNMFAAELSELEGTDPNDLNFAQNLQNTPLPNFGVSAYWWSEEFFLGLSAPRLIENQIPSGTDMIQNQEKRHFFLMGGYTFPMSEDVKFQPTFLSRYVSGAPVSVDLNANFYIHDWLWLGASARLGDSFGLIAAFRLSDQFRIGYSFDFQTNQLVNYTTGSHEFMMSYDIQFGKNRLRYPCWN
jgi:type IX secretion system PorP/SprF family membrane protein